jgi:large subunit ribosomal protein L24e
MLFLQVHIYLSSKCQRSADMRRNPRRVTWTVYYRRKHKKGAAEQEIKKRTRRNIKFQRAITGVTWNEILAKRNQQPEFRKAQRQDAIKYDSIKFFSVFNTKFCFLYVNSAAKQAKKVKAQKKATQPSGLKVSSSKFLFRIVYLISFSRLLNQ